MVKCKVKETCFYGGKRYKKGETLDFKGTVKDIPKYLEQTKEDKK